MLRRKQKGLNMIRIALTLLAAASLTACSGGSDGPAGGDVVTVHGAIDAFNRDTVDSVREPLFRAYGIEFESGYAFSAASLGELDQRDVQVAYPEGGDRHTFSGPLLRDVIAQTGSSGSIVTVTALDGYQRDIELSRIQDHDVILAIRMDGEALNIGGFGPAMIVWPRESDDALAGMDDSDWVWGVFSIELR